MSEPSPRVLLTLVGNLQQDAFARVKYGQFCEALERTGARIDTLDGSLRGLPRIWNALRVFSPSISIWRERFWKNLPAFEARSKNVGRYIQARKAQWDIVVQIGVVFDAGRYQNQLPVVIYTDYTARLSAERPEAGRSPFSADQRDQWFDYERRAYDSALHIFTRSKAVQESVIHGYGIPSEKVTVINAGVNFALLPEADSCPDTGALVLFIGKEFHRKGGDILLEAFAKARKYIPSARLRMVTKGPIPSGLPLDGVEVIAPTWNRSELARLYCEADLFVLPSRLETWGDVLLEAMAYYLPCIGVHSDAMGEIILDGETGLLVPPQDSEALAEALIRLLSDPLERTRMGQAGRRRVESSYTWDSVVARMSQVLNHSLKKEGII